MGATAPGLRVGVSLEPIDSGVPGRSRRTVELACSVERAGLDDVAVNDHLLGDGTGVEPLVALAAIAGATTSVGLSTSILVAPVREPLLLANQTATLDAVCGGRFSLAVGTGWDEREFAAVGAARTRRGALTDEHLAALRRWWSAPEAGDGEPGAFALPGTAGGPRVYIGGGSDAAFRRVARFGDGWHGAGADEDDLRHARAVIDARCEELGRDPATVELSTVAFLAVPGSTPPGAALPGRPLGGPRATAGSVADDVGRLRDAGLARIVLWAPLPADALADALAWWNEEVAVAVG